MECLLNNKLQDISIQFKDGSPSVILSHDFDEAFMSKLFQTYVKFYKNALKHAGLYKVNKKVKAEVSFEFDYCSVYLMHDTRNGFHKIGISKTPTYREKTLQSEKPTIELICSKEYPSRKIAEAIESALHKVYENNRIRGEWFDLSEKDILIIRETLK